MKYSEVFTKPPPWDLNEVRFLTQNFQNEFNQILSVNETEAMTFAESFFHQFPFQRHLSRTMAIFFRDQMGLSSGYRRLIKTFVDVTQNILNFVLINEFGFYLGCKSTSTSILGCLYLIFSFRTPKKFIFNFTD